MDAGRSTSCLRCGLPWWRWSESRRPCHAGSLVTQELEDDIYRVKLQFPLLALDRLASDLGLSAAVVRAAANRAARRAGRPLPRWGVPE